MAYFKGEAKPEVEKAVLRYMQQYPYAAYLTAVEKEGDNMDGGYYTHVIRLRKDK